MKNMIKAVIFDRDGVIVDSEPINLESGIKAFAQQGIEITEDEKKIIIGTHPVDYQDYFKKKYSGFDFAKFREVKREMYVKGRDIAPLFENAINLIKKLHQQNMPLALVTTASKNGTLSILKRAGLENIFPTIVTFEDCDKRKPAPDGYLLAAKKLNVLPQECLVFEDSSIGLQAAKNAGMTCYVVPTKTTADQDFSLADKIINDKAELNQLLIKYK